MADIEELVLKIGVEVDAEQLKRLRDEIKRMQENGSKNAIKLGVSPEHTGTIGQTINSSTGNQIISGDYSQELLAALTLSEKHLMDILNITKQDHEKKQRVTDNEERRKGPFPFVQDLTHQGIGGGVGMGIGAIAGGIFGGPGGAVAGAEIGSVIGNFFEKIFSGVKEKLDLAVDLLGKQLEENMQFEVIRNQTGMTSDQIHILGIQAKIAGTSLQEIIDSNQALSDELIGGISEKKAQLLMALNINPRQALIQSGGDIGKLNQMIFQRSNQALQGANPYYRSSVLNMLGYDPHEATSRKYLYRPEVQAKAEGINQIATNAGKTPIHNGEQNLLDRMTFIGNTELIAAVLREALTKAGAVQALATKYMEVKAETVQLVVKSINDILGLDKNIGTSANDILRNNAQKINSLNQTENDNGAQRAMIQNQLNHHNQNSPASGSGSAKAGAAQ